MFSFKEKIIESIGFESYDAWFSRKPVKIHSPLFGTIVIEASSRFFRDSIIQRFGERLHDIAKKLGYTKLHILSSGQEIPRNDPLLTPEQWSEIKGILSKIGKFSQSKGRGKAPKELFSHGIMEDEMKEIRQKPTPSHVYKGMNGLEKLFFLKNKTVENEKSDLTSEGVIFHVEKNPIAVIVNQDSKFLTSICPQDERETHVNGVLVVG